MYVPRLLDCQQKVPDPSKVKGAVVVEVTGLQPSVMGVGVRVGVFEIAGVSVRVGVRVGVFEIAGVSVRVGVRVGVLVKQAQVVVGVGVRVGVFEIAGVSVRVEVRVGVLVIPGVSVRVGVLVAVPPQVGSVPGKVASAPLREGFAAPARTG